MTFKFSTIQKNQFFQILFAHKLENYKKRLKNIPQPTRDFWNIIKYDLTKLFNFYLTTMLIMIKRIVWYKLEL